MATRWFSWQRVVAKSVRDKCDFTLILPLISSVVLFLPLVFLQIDRTKINSFHHNYRYETQTKQLFLITFFWWKINTHRHSPGKISNFSLFFNWMYTNVSIDGRGLGFLEIRYNSMLPWKQMKLWLLIILEWFQYFLRKSSKLSLHLINKTFLLLPLTNITRRKLMSHRKYFQRFVY